MDDLITIGGSVKALGDGKVGGYLVLFGDPSSRDLADDYFTADTDFAIGDGAKSAVYYEHGLDETLGTRRIGAGTLEVKDAGVWIEAQLDRRDEYERAVYGLAEQKKLGWSSGTASHLVRRETVGAAKHITYWPLGLDASLTPTPCDPRNRVMSVKSYRDFLADGAPHDGTPLVEHSHSVLATVKEFTERITGYAALKARDGRQLSEAKRAELKAHMDAMQSLGEALSGLLADGAPLPTDAEANAAYAAFLRTRADLTQYPELYGACT